jgi:hypothetical protein
VSHWSACGLDEEVCDEFLGPCGDADDDVDVDASDALTTLRAAVGGEPCGLAYCDVDSSGTVSVVDALAILQIAVGRAVVLSCPDLEP